MVTTLNLCCFFRNWENNLHKELLQVLENVTKTKKIVSKCKLLNLIVVSFTFAALKKLQ